MGLGRKPKKDFKGYEMKRSELNKLIAVVGRLRKDAKGLRDRADNEYKNAGCSATSAGTGDEGWAAVFRLSGIADGLDSAAEDIRRTIIKFEIEGDK